MNRDIPRDPARDNDTTPAASSVASDLHLDRLLGNLDTAVSRLYEVNARGRRDTPDVRCQRLHTAYSGHLEVISTRLGALREYIATLDAPPAPASTPAPAPAPVPRKDEFTPHERLTQREKNRRKNRSASEYRKSLRMPGIDGRPVAPLPEGKHGTVTGYNYHFCRCPDCTRVYRAYQVNKEQKNREARARSKDAVSRNLSLSADTTDPK